MRVWGWSYPWVLVPKDTGLVIPLGMTKKTRGTIYPWVIVLELSHPNFFFIFMIIIIYSSTKELILKYSISALKNLNVEFLLEFVQKEDMENLL